MNIDILLLKISLQKIIYKKKFKIKKYSENLTIDYNIVERVVVKITKDDQEIIKTINLISFIEDYDQDLEVLEYILYIAQKKKEQGGCDNREHFQCINSGEYFLNIKSLKSSDKIVEYQYLQIH